LLFLLLKKKECQVLQKILRSSSELIHQVDEDGNDPLLYICLKVRGCRHRIIEFLIMMGCDLYRRNLNNENFIDAIQLRRNQSLLKNLLENEIIKIDDQSGQIQVILKTQLQQSSD
jgi:ankyrin repeat protein